MNPHSLGWMICLPLVCLTPASPAPREVAFLVQAPGGILPETLCILALRALSWTPDTTCSFTQRKTSENRRVFESLFPGFTHIQFSESPPFANGCNLPLMGQLYCTRHTKSLLDMADMKNPAAILKSPGFVLWHHNMKTISRTHLCDLDKEPAAL